MLKLSIPQPCHEDWDKMNLNEQGRHCSSCVKTVVDFTGMNDEEVKNFFLNKKEATVCGRFKEKQLQQIVIDLPQNIFRIEMPIWKRFLVASLMVFSTTLFSCNTSIDGQLVKNGEAMEMISSLQSIQYSISHKIMGFIGAPDTIPVQHCTHTMGIIMPKLVQNHDEHILKGDVEMLITDTVKPKKSEPILMGKPSVQQVIQNDTSTNSKIRSKPDPGDCNTKTLQ